MDTRNNDFDFDFTPIGQAIKKARTAKGMTREQLARIVDYDPRHLQAIENEGKSKKSSKIAGLNKFLRQYYGKVRNEYIEIGIW